MGYFVVFAVLHLHSLIAAQKLNTVVGFCLNKAGFHMIADCTSQIAIRSAIVCDHVETTSAIVCDPAIVIADDRRR